MSGSSVVWQGVLGSLAAGACTGMGGLLVFLRAEWSRAAQASMLALAAGVMLGATVFSLLVPALDVVRSAGGSELHAALVAGGGVCLGALGVWGLHAVTPHEHFLKGREDPFAVALGRHWLFVLAITLHNIPEGMSVGVAYGAGPTVGATVAGGIGLQNVPEGLAVAAALISAGSDRSRAFWIALATGLIEPVGGLVGAVSVAWSALLLPWGLAIAAGAMLFVISGEIIPETHRHGAEHRATLALVAGFVVMMLLDVALSPGNGPM